MSVWRWADVAILLPLFLAAVGLLLWRNARGGPRGPGQD
jgi:hypothetical protein